MEIAGLGETIRLNPGQHGYEIRRGDEVIVARRFTVLKGDNSALRISDERAIPEGQAERRAEEDVESAATEQADSDSVGRLSRPEREAAQSPLLAIAPFDAVQAKQHQQAWSDYLDVPVEATNSIDIKSMLIPPGEFDMGSTQEEIEPILKDPNLPDWFKGTPPRDSPQHRVRLTKPFALGAYEVTLQQYQKVMGTSPPNTGEVMTTPDADRHPVETVNWYDAIEFCNKLSEQEGIERHYRRDGDAVSVVGGNGYRLPTEAEWEYACRAGTMTPFHFGNVLDGREANCDGSHPYGTSAKGTNLRRPTKEGLVRRECVWSVRHAWERSRVVRGPV